MTYLLHFINEYKFMQCVSCTQKESKLVNIFVKNKVCILRTGWAQMVALVNGIGVVSHC